MAALRKTVARSTPRISAVLLPRPALLVCVRQEVGFRFDHGVPQTGAVPVQRLTDWMNPGRSLRTISSPCDMTIMRSTTFRSSLTLPGQE